MHDVETEQQPDEWLFRLPAYIAMYWVVGLVAGPLVVILWLAAAGSGSPEIAAVIVLSGAVVEVIVWLLVVVLPLRKTGQTFAMKLLGLPGWSARTVALRSSDRSSCARSCRS